MEVVVEYLEPTFDVGDAPEEPGVVPLAGDVLVEEGFDFFGIEDVAAFKFVAANHIEDIRFEGAFKPKGEGSGVAFFVGPINYFIR